MYNIVHNSLQSIVCLRKHVAPISNKELYNLSKNEKVKLNQRAQL